MTGLVEAVQFSAIRAPRLAGARNQRLQITWLASNGTQVRKGDLLVEFDRQDQDRAIEDRRAEWLDFEEQIRKKQAEQLAERAKDETAIEAAANAVTLTQLDVRKNEVLPKIDAEKNMLALELAQARLAQLKEIFELKRKAALYDLQILEVRRDRVALTLRQAEQNALDMSVRSPINGLVVYRNFWRGGRMGDPITGLELGSGAVILDVIGTEAMRVRVKVNQADVRLLHVGESATVRLDAFPRKVYQARLEQLAPAAVVSGFSTKVRSFAATFRIENADRVLMPDLSASVDVEMAPGGNASLTSRNEKIATDRLRQSSSGSR